MWIGIIAAIVLTVLLFTIGTNKKTSWHTKENKNVVDDPGSDGVD
jgi:hypothetical protein